MSERGSFGTQLIQCDACIEKLKSVFDAAQKRETKSGVDGWVLPNGRIFAGIIRAFPGSPGEEWEVFRDVFSKDNAPCHPVSAAVFTDSGEIIPCRIMPDGSVEEWVVD